jgi:hypothetical protein
VNEEYVSSTEAMTDDNEINNETTVNGREENAILNDKEVLEKLRYDIDNLEYRTVKEKYLKMDKMYVMLVKLDNSIEEEDKNDRQKCKELDYWANRLITEGTNLMKISDYQEKKVKLAGQIKTSYQVMARRDFEKFLIAVEWNYAPDMKFYEIRKNVLRDWCKELERLEYGDYKGLSISAPPRTRKNDCSENVFLHGVCYATQREVASSYHILQAWQQKYIMM